MEPVNPTPPPEPTPPPPPPAPPNPAPDPAPPFSKAWFWKMVEKYLPTNLNSIISVLVMNTITAILVHFGLSKPIPPAPIPEPIWFEGETGWRPPSDEERKAALNSPNVFQFDQTEAGGVEDAAGDADGNAFLWKLAVKVRGQGIPVLNQLQVGSCVGHGFATAVNYAIAIQAALRRGPPIEPNVFIAPEVIYGGSRVNANGMRRPFPMDGSTGADAARFITTDGCCDRGIYGPYDVSKYSESMCRRLGQDGIRGELLDACRKNIVGSAALVKTGDELKKAILQGYPVAVCSNVGFARQSSRDADGFLEARGQWLHCMAFIGFRKDKNAFYCMNSWGEDWITGPTGPGEPPPGGFWVKFETAHRMMTQGDSYAISNVKGFPRRKINPNDWIIKADAAKFLGDDQLPRFGGIQNALAP